MTTITMTKRGAVTIPPDLRRKLGVDGVQHALLIVEERDGGLFLQPAAAVPLRDIPRATIDAWISEDKRGLEAWKRKGRG